MTKIYKYADRKTGENYCQQKSRQQKFNDLSACLLHYVRNTDFVNVCTATFIFYIHYLSLKLLCTRKN